MAGLTDKAGGANSKCRDVIDQARQAWQESMSRQMETLRASIQEHEPAAVADRCGGSFEGDRLCLTFWGKPVGLSWPDLQAHQAPEVTPCSTFDTAMLLYYIHTADGTPMADRWISFRELPDGAFYHQAFQGYSGDLLARAFGDESKAFNGASRALDGWSLPALAPYAYAFQPLPRIRLAAVLWPGDEEFPPRASVLFDASASHYMPTDGLALLGAGLAQRLIRTASST